MRRLLITVSCLAVSFAVQAAYERPAQACGGCLSPAEQVTTVDSHRMVISLGLEQTVLWDQIQYSGSPEDFVWVLPVPSETVQVDIADSAFFDQLDNQTAPRIQPLSPPPRLFCPSEGGGGGGFGCGAAALSADDGGGNTAVPEDSVTVFDQGVVGPYETLTIGAEDPNALLTWLTDNGYAVSNEVLPAIDHYIDLQHAFVVLRLRPDFGVQAMEPVRVTYPGFMGTFPLKMVVVGAQGVLDLSLWVIAEQRYEARNYGTIAINVDELAWDWDSNTSNYRDVFEDTVERGGNRAWIAEFAGPFDSLFLDVGADVQLIREANPFPYITRLRTRVLVDHIDQDLELSPSANASDVSNVLLAPIDINRPADVDCSDVNDDDDEGIYCNADTGSGRGALSLAAIMMLGLMVVLRRRRRA